VTTQERIHLVALGLSEPIEPWRALAETIPFLRRSQYYTLVEVTSAAPCWDDVADAIRAGRTKPI